MTGCPYKNYFGAPGTGVHGYRFLGIAIVDAVLTVLVAGGVAWAASWNFWYTLGGLFLTGILLHHLFCVRTTIDKLIWP